MSGALLFSIIVHSAGLGGLWRLLGYDTNITDLFQSLHHKRPHDRIFDTLRVSRSVVHKNLKKQFSL